MQSNKERMKSSKKLKKIYNRIWLLLSPYIRRFRHPLKCKSIEFLYHSLQGENVYLNKLAQKNKKKIIYEICTLDNKYVSFYFPKGCACLVSDKGTAQKAMRKGARMLITSENYENYPCLVADNTISIYARLCSYYRNLSDNLYMTAVSGSIGKTTIKNMIGEVYKMKFKTFYTSLNYNTTMSVGYAVQHIPADAEMMVQEIHEGNPGETRYISQMLEPDLFVLTPIDKSHYERFGSELKIKKEICSITEYMKSDGKVIVDIDEFSDFDLLNGKTVITISTFGQDADFSVSNMSVTNIGLELCIRVKNTGSVYPVSLKNIFARHNAQCALFAFAAGYHVGIHPMDIVKGLQNFRTSGDRQNFFRTYNGVLVYADCYNAIGRSMLSAIDTANNVHAKGNRIAVLGDIAETGVLSCKMHQEIIHKINSSSFEYLFTIGEEFNKVIINTPIKDSLKVKSAQSLEELSAMVREVVQPEDLVLFKASHSSNLSECIKILWPEDYQKNIAILTVEHQDWLKSTIRQ